MTRREATLVGAALFTAAFCLLPACDEESSDYGSSGSGTAPAHDAGTTPTADGCAPGARRCEGDDVWVCESPQWALNDCETECNWRGFTEPYCDDNAACQCEEYLDPQCRDGAWAMELCGRGDMGPIYANCMQDPGRRYSDSQETTCYANYLGADTVDCEPAARYCDPFGGCDADCASVCGGVQACLQGCGCG